MQRIAVLVFMILFSQVKLSFGQIENLVEFYGFGEIETIKLDWQISGLIVKDFDGDGLNDIAISNNIKSKIDILMQKENIDLEQVNITVDPEDADINTLDGQTRYRRESVNVSQRILSIVAGDLNSDGLADLAYHGDPRGLYIQLQKSSDEKGKLEWKNRRKIAVDDALTALGALICDDLNGDGKDDLLLAGKNVLYFVLQKEDGTLEEPVSYAAAAGSQILGIAIGDLNGDRFRDIVIVTADRDKPVRVRFGQQNGKPGAEMSFGIEPPLSLELYDLDGDGKDEIVTVDAISKRLIVYSLSQSKDTGGDWPMLTYPLSTGGDASKRDMEICDLDGDGLVDVVVSDPGAAEIIVYMQEDFGLAEPRKFSSFSQIDSISVADIDSDNKSEVIVLSVKEKAIGVAKFNDERMLFPDSVMTMGEPLAMDVADMDGDKKTDLVYVANDANNIKWLCVKKGWTDSSENIRLELKGVVSNPDSIMAIDADQDGLMDVLIFDKYNPPPVLVRQMSMGTFERIDAQKSRASLIKDATKSLCFAADVDEKKGQELIIAQNNFARSLVLSSDGVWGVLDQYNSKSSDASLTLAAAQNLFGNDKSGCEILLLDGKKGRLEILTKGEDGTYSLEKELNVGTWGSAKHAKMEFAKLSRRDRNDLIIFDGEKFVVITPADIEMEIADFEKIISYETKIRDGAYSHMQAGDINSDGQADLALVEFKGNHLEILTFGNDNEVLPALRFKIFERKSYREDGEPVQAFEPREMRIADVTGDGKNDLVAVIHDRIIIYPQD